MTGQRSDGVAVLSAGVSIPRLRLAAGTIPGHDPKAAGELSIDAQDEDAATMAAEAARRALGSGGPNAATVDSLFFASQTPGARTLVPHLAEMLRLKGEVSVFTFSGSPLASPEALLGASNEVLSGKAKVALVIASDSGAWQSDPFGVGGSAAVAFVLAADGRVRLSDSSSSRTDMTQRPVAAYGEERIARAQGYERCLSESVKRLIGREQKEGHSLVLPGQRSDQLRVSKALGLQPENLIDGTVRGRTGCRGCLEPLLGMVEALSSDARPSNLIVGFYGAGEGSTSLLVKSAEGLKVAGLETLDRGKKITFQDYLGLVEKRKASDEGSGVYALNLPSLLRSSKSRLSLLGWKCPKCGRITARKASACAACRSAPLEEVELPRRGKVYSYSIIDIPPEGFEAYAPYPIAVVELEGGTKLQAQLTDCDADGISIGMEVEAVVRVLYRSQGLVSYSTKFRPAYR